MGSKERCQVKKRLYPRTAHGGFESRGKRKTERPFSPKAPIHIVLKSARAKGTWSLLHRKNQSRITSMIYVYASRFKVHVYEAANVGNHLHLLVKADDRKNLADYLRVLAGRIAVTVTGAQKYVKRVGRFWDHLCWSRLVAWGKEFHFVKRYIFANELEFLGKHIRNRVLRNPYLIPEDSS
jgi:REP element-mobilizing transposase RayT